MDLFYWIGGLLFIGLGIFRLVHPEEFADDDTYRRFIIDFKPFKNNIQFERFGGILHVFLGVLLIFLSFIK